MTATPDLVLICDTCHKAIANGEGNLWIDDNDVRHAQRLHAAWDRAHTQYDGDIAAGIAATGADLLDLVADVPWQAHHNACDPQPHANAYAIAAAEIRTWGQLLDWTAHLMEKPWLVDTDWGDLLRGVAGGTKRLIAVTASREGAL